MSVIFDAESLVWDKLLEKKHGASNMMIRYVSGLTVRRRNFARVTFLLRPAHCLFNI